MEITLTPEQINEFLSKTVLESKIGDEVKKSIDRVLEKLGTSYDNPFDHCIQQEVYNIIQRMMQTVFYEQVKKMIEEKLKDKITDDFVGKLVETAFEKIKGRYS